MRIEPRPLPEQLPDLGDLPPLLTRLYAARGVQSISELDKGLARLITSGCLAYSFKNPPAPSGG